jgi:DNA-binding response OmpR family regulator
MRSSLRSRGSPALPSGKRQSRGQLHLNQSNSQLVVEEDRLLSISPVPEDHVCLERMLDLPSSSLLKSDTASTVYSLLVGHNVSVIICERDVLPGSWVEVLIQAARLPHPPLLVVTSALADERLWAEALNVGAWDVLPKPLIAAEVVRVVSVARERWHDQRKNPGGRLLKTSTTPPTTVRKQPQFEVVPRASRLG